MPGDLHSHAHADSSLLQFSVEFLSFSIAVIQFPFTALPSLLIHKSNLLKARVIIYSYNDHVRLLPPEPLVVMQPQSTRVEGADIVMKSFLLCVDRWVIYRKPANISPCALDHPECPPKHLPRLSGNVPLPCRQASYSGFVNVWSFTSWPRGRNHEQADQATLRCAWPASYRSRIAPALYR